ncbi:dethiobiotin synthase [Selenomonas sp. oral taxon 892 str. F0426]|uniref:dethiobiotin synthase n=1 Tax=Selenomonas sp. oral taxon 892 TaxID=1321785 RepID=UPI0003AD735F|nr:dethiobiotin synthase [Selenomonas sp. oral taxon 892]ERJ90014.1 dethiobiotin synthase [Selenomonas sp. oral taxon 892 str. F0426]
MGKALFITGTGTDIGKTYVTGLIVKKLRDAGLRAGYYKAALSGAETLADGTLLPGDALHVAHTAGLAPEDAAVSYIYRDAVSPHLAAQIEGRPMDFDKVEQDFHTAKERMDYLTVEGSGGIICPLRWDNEEHVILDDLALRLGLSALVVADAGLGTINAAVLTAEHLKMRGIPLKGFIFNNWTGGTMQEDNVKMVEALTGAPVLARVEHGDAALPMAADALAALYD